MAQFQKEELIGPGPGDKPAPGAGPARFSAPPPGIAETTGSGIPSSALSDLVVWVKEHRRLALVGAFGVGVFLGAMARR